jgi:hypothetical protein
MTKLFVIVTQENVAVCVWLETSSTPHKDIDRQYPGHKVWTVAKTEAQAETLSRKLERKARVAA